MKPSDLLKNIGTKRRPSSGRTEAARSSGSTRLLPSRRTVFPTLYAARSGSRRTGSLDITFLVLVLIILTIGLVMLFSASYAFAYYNYGDSFYHIKRQALWAVLGVVAMIIISHINYRILFRLAVPLLAGSTFLLILALILPARRGRYHRWIDIGPGFQPSEIAKFAIIVMFAVMIVRYGKKRMATFRYGVAPFMVILGVTAGLIVIEPHLSATIIVIGLGLLMMFIGGTKWRWFALGGAAIVAILVMLLLFTDILSHAWTRLEGWLDPFSDVQNTTFQTAQSLMAIGSGGLMGLGLGGSRQKYLYVPEPQNDFIFAIVCEELGFIGAVIIILLFALLIWRGFLIAMRCNDQFGSLLAIGLVLQLALQVFLNIAVVTNTIPNTGIGLPFFSYGGTSMLMTMGQMGLILSVSRYSSLEKS